MFILNLLNLVSFMKVPRVPHGVTLFAVGTAAASYLAAQSTAETQKKREEELRKEIYGLRSDVKKLDDKVTALESDITEIKAETKAISKAISDKSKNSFNSLGEIPSIKEIFSQMSDYFSSFDLFGISLIFNILCSSFLLSLLASFLFGKYGNYLLDKFNIEFKYPKLSRVLKLRLKVQSYYFTYITVLGIITLLVNIILNTKAFLGL